MFNPIFLTDEYFYNFMLPADDGDDLSGGDSPDGPTPAAAPDASVLSGQPDQTQSGMPGIPTAPPAAAPAQAAPAAPAAAPAAPAALPDNTPPGRAGVTYGNGGLVKAAGTPSVWKQIVLGALIGMSSGGKNFAQGAQMGSENVRNAEQTGVENFKSQQQLKFQSLEAANSVIRLRNETRAADNADQEHQITMSNQMRDANEWADEHMQPRPYQINGTSSADTQAQGAGMLKTVSNANGGSIPIVTGTTSTKGQGPDKDKHQINIYAPTAADLATPDGQNAALDAINLANKIQNPNAPDLTWEQVKQMGASANPQNPRAGVQAMWARSQGLIIGQAPLSTAKTADEISAENAGMQAHLEQQLETYSKSPNADKSTVNALTSQLESFKTAAARQRQLAAQGQSDTTVQTAPAKASAAQQEELAKQNTPQGRAELAKTQAETAKTQVETKKAEFDLNAATGGAEWKPKVTADEKKKAELAENIAFNGNEVNGILARRPDIVGAVAGRYTTVQQMIGSNDPDIQAIGVHIHNMAMANSGVHGFRSQEGVQETENLLLNKFKNGPDAVRGAVQANTDSVQTFIDNARPDTYATHSKNGGAANYYVKQATVARADAAKVHANMTDFKQVTPTKEHGNLYTDDGKTWYTQDGNVYKGK